MQSKQPGVARGLGLESIHVDDTVVETWEYHTDSGIGSDWDTIYIAFRDHDCSDIW